MVTRDVQANLRKYKMACGKTPSRRSTSCGIEDEDSPQVRFEGDRRGRSMGHRGEDESAGGNRAIRQYLKELDKGVGDKMSLLKMLVIKCDEAD